MSDNVNVLDPEQARRMALVCLDLHAALGVEWGDDLYAAIQALRSADYKEGCEAAAKLADLYKSGSVNDWLTLFPNGMALAAAIRALGREEG